MGDGMRKEALGKTAIRLGYDLALTAEGLPCWRCVVCMDLFTMLPDAPHPNHQVGDVK